MFRSTIVRVDYLGMIPRCKTTPKVQTTTWVGNTHDAAEYSFAGTFGDTPNPPSPLDFGPVRGTTGNVTKAKECIGTA